MNKKRTKQILRIGLLLGTLTSLFFVPWIVVWAWILPLPDTIQEQANEAIDHGFDGIIVYVDEAGKAPALYASGLHSRQDDIPARPDALFKIASISKLYTALAITKLVRDGQLSLDKSLSEYFPELVGRIEHAETITLKMMVQHRSGIPNYTDNPGFWMEQPSGRQAALDFALDLPANFEPGKEYGYSNTNYLLLRELMDRILGYEHFQYIKQEILVPLELNHTFGSVREVDIDDVMSGYYVGYEEDLKTDDRGMVATVEDVGKFIRALNEGTAFEEGEEEIYASIYVYEHTGLVPGYQSIAKYHKDINTVVVQFTNTTDFNGYQWNTSEVVYSRIVKILRRQRGS